MNEAEIAKQNLRRAMQLEIERVLMSGELEPERASRVESMLQAMKTFLAHAEEHTALPDQIQAERYRRLGFSPEIIEQMKNPWNTRQAERATESLIRAAQVFGIGDDGDEEAEEAEEVPMTPVEAPLAVPLKLVRQTISLLKGVGGDGDVADSFEELLSACDVSDETEPDTVIAVETGHVVMACVGLAVCAEVPARDVGAELRGIIEKGAIGWLPHVDRAVQRVQGAAS